jgi:hypothetical protein
VQFYLSLVVLKALPVLIIGGRAEEARFRLTDFLRA